LGAGAVAEVVVPLCLAKAGFLYILSKMKLLSSAEVSYNLQPTIYNTADGSTRKLSTQNILELLSGYSRENSSLWSSY
jgi:hypothetical protein